MSMLKKNQWIECHHSHHRPVCYHNLCTTSSVATMTRTMTMTISPTTVAAMMPIVGGSSQ